MELSDFIDYISESANNGIADREVLEYIKKQTGRDYANSTLTNFRRQHDIEKISKAQRVINTHGDEIKQLYIDGHSIKQISSQLEIPVKYVSSAVSVCVPLEKRRITTSLLIEHYKKDIQYFIKDKISCRNAVTWLQNTRKISCNKNVVLRAIKKLKEVNQC